MAWRIDEVVVRGEIDNRTRGRVTGTIWLAGRDQPVRLDLEGNAWRDLAGHLLRFTNPRPAPGRLDGFAEEQDGAVGDITGSRKVKVPDCSMEELGELYAARKPFPWHWGNSLYLEWFSLRNGRVVIESTDYEIEIDSDPAWEMTGAEEDEQRAENARALTSVMDRLGAMLAGADGELDDDDPQSPAEAQADAEAARMDRLLDRISARIEREGRDEIDFESIYHEERERLRRETGEPPEPEPTPEQEAERAAWIEEMNAASEEALAEMESEAWKPEPKRPPLLDRAMDLAADLRQAIEPWLPDDAPAEHPLREIAWGVQFAAVKIGGALGHDADEEWPPDPLFAGDTLVRLKKSRDCLRDALRATDSADEERLGTPEWRTATRREIAEILGQVQQLIHEVREVLADDQGGG